MKKMIETTRLQPKEENKKLVVKLQDFHSYEYLRKLKETTYKNKKVVFILPNGKEVK